MIQSQLRKGAKIQELSQSNLSATDTEKLIFFENLFYLLLSHKVVNFVEGSTGFTFYRWSNFLYRE